MATISPISMPKQNWSTSRTSGSCRNARSWRSPPRVALDATQMRIDDRMVNLEPGMAVTVEIKTGTRRLIEYLMSPLLRYRQESLRER